jgi:hypothetical protein
MSNVENPSILILGMKRSGTNWVESTLVPLVPSAANEPLGLHNDSDPANPLNPWNYSSRSQVSSEYGHTKLEDNPYGALLTRSFLDWLREGNKLIKETDFLYADWLLHSAPLKTLVLQRDPRGSIASIKKWGLYENWGLDERMEHFKRTVMEEPELRDLYQGLFDGFEESPTHRKLATYYAIGISEIARVTQDQDVVKARYEDLVANPLANFREITRLLGLPWTPEIERLILEKTTQSSGQNPYGTYRARRDIQNFMSFLTPAEERDIREILRNAGIMLEKPEEITYEGFEIPKSLIRASSETAYTREDVLNNRVTNSVELDGSLSVSKTLTSKSEYAAFLNWLLDNGIPLSYRGFNIFHNDRGESKIRAVDGHIEIEDGAEDYPATFVNWIGASLFAAWAGGRLPTSQEWERYLREPNQDRENALQKVSEGETNERGVHHASNNVAVWLRDEVNNSSFERSRAGKPWNHPTDLPVSPTPRPYWLGTTGLGIRVIYDGNEALSDDVLAKKIKDIVAFLTTDSHINAAHSNQRLFEMVNNLVKIESDE